MARIKLYASLGRDAGVNQVEVDAPDVRRALQSICAGNQVLSSVLLEDGHLRDHIHVMVNGADITRGQGLDTPLGPDDQVAILPPVGGGQRSAMRTY